MKPGRRHRRPLKHHQPESPLPSRTRNVVRSLLLLAPLASSTAAHAQGGSASGNWPHYGRDPGNSRYSPLTDIDRSNVARLSVAWRFHTGEAARQPKDGKISLEVTPIVVDGTMFLSTPRGQVFALDAPSGTVRWRHQIAMRDDTHFGDHANRGVTWWVDSSAAAGSRCRARLFVPVVDARIVALDAETGKPCAGFGTQGELNLRTGLRNPPAYFEEYELTSPPVVVGGVLVTGSAVADNNRTDAPSGEVRGYDARTGALRWRWDPIPSTPDAASAQGWNGPRALRTGAANAWSVLAADHRRGLVFVPTGSPSVDYYGGTRLGDNRHGNSIVALRAGTGAVAWAFQVIHHDLWDYDNASPPALATIRHDGRDVDVVLQANKAGMLFVLDRDSGRPVFPVEERAVPASDVPGDVAARTQPFSSLPALSPQRFDTASLGALSPADREGCLAAIRGFRNEGIFTPPSLQGTLVMPSNIGGAHWGGLAIDSARQLAIIPVNTVLAAVQLLPEAPREARQPRWEYTRMQGTPYVMRRTILRAPSGAICSPPPFGELVAIDLAHGTLAWRVPLGTLGTLAPPELANAPLGSPNLGGPIVTAGGLAFMAGTVDRKLRAFDVETGRELWAGDLPAGGKATPMTYLAGGRQFVVIAAGGDGGVFGWGDEVVAFSVGEAAR